MKKTMSMILMLALIMSLLEIPIHAQAATVAISRATATLEIYATLPLAVKNAPKGATVAWSSGAKDIATVNAKTGKVTAKKVGTATITAKVTVNKKATNYICKVTVVDANKGVAPKYGMSRVTAQTEIYSTLPLAVKGLAKNATVVWTSGNSKIATVTKNTADQGAKVYAKKAGSVTVTAKVSSGKSYICKITIKDANKVSLEFTGPTIGSGGFRHMAVKSDGSLWAWGINDYGSLGNGSYTDSEKPIKVLSGIASFDMGYNTSAAVKTDGTLWTWGLNVGGVSIGHIDSNLTLSGANSDVLLPGKIRDQIAAVYLNHYGDVTFVIKLDKSLWGINQKQIITYDREGWFESASFEDTKILDDVEKIFKGDFHYYAIKTDGSLWDFDGRTFGVYNSYTPPIKIMDGVVDFVCLSNASFIVKKDGSLWGMGSNKFISLGDESKASEDHFVELAKGVKKIVAAPITDGNFFSATPSLDASYHGNSDSFFIIKNDSSLWAWGDNDAGCLGIGTSETQYKPVKVMDNVQDVKTSQYKHTLILKKDGSLWACGSNVFGALGNGHYGGAKSGKYVYSPKCAPISPTYTDDMLWTIRSDYSYFDEGIDESVPVKIMDDVVDISVSYSESLALKKDGSLWVWGNVETWLLNKNGKPLTLSDLLPDDFGQLHYEGTYHRDGSRNDWGMISYAHTERATPRKILDGVKTP